MTTFNELLSAHDIDVRQVSLLRHQTRTASGDTPYALWRRDVDAFERYQSTQLQRPVFRDSRYWAAFVAPAKLETLFVGLYEVRRIEGGVIDWLDPLTGDAVGAGKNKPYDLYDYDRMEVMADQIGNLRIDWSDNDRTWMQPSVRSWAQYASRNSKRVIPSAQQPVTRTISRDRRHDELASMLRSIGFVEAHRTDKVSLHVHADIAIYLKRRVERLPLIIHPWFEAAYGDLARIEGISFELPLRYYVNSNLNRFPLFVAPGRATASRYGLACDVLNLRAMEALTDALEKNRVIHTPDGDVDIAGEERETDRLERRLGRIGQGAFRCGLNRYWDGRCAVTGAALPELLRASHIVAWKDATNVERLDPFNGLLLGAHLDALFDKHLIGFEDDGRLKLASRIQPALLAQLGIDANTARLSRLDPRHQPYLSRHRALVV